MSAGVFSLGWGSDPSIVPMRLTGVGAPRRYGSIYNPNVKYAIPSPLGATPDRHQGHTDHDDFPVHEMAARNEYDEAMEDFTNTSGDDEAPSFPPVAAKLFADAALVSDPIKVRWWNLHQLNECDPTRVQVPTLVVRI